MSDQALNVHGLPLPEPVRYVTRAQLAQRLQVSVDTIDRYRKAGMPFVRCGPRLIRFDERQATAWVHGPGAARWAA